MISRKLDQVMRKAYQEADAETNPAVYASMPRWTVETRLQVPTHDFQGMC